MKWLKNIINNFRENRELKEAYKLQLDKVISKLKELKQDKVYILEVEGDVEKNINDIKTQLSIIGKAIPWTLPPIVILQGGTLREKKGEVRNNEKYVFLSESGISDTYSETDTSSGERRNTNKRTKQTDWNDLSKHKPMP